MDQCEKDFIRGYACCLANAATLEDWRPDQINGGISWSQMIAAGVDKHDLDILKPYKKDLSYDR